MIRMGDIEAQMARATATVRGTLERLAGSVHIELHPQPNEREGSQVTNTAVLHFLGARNPELLAPDGADMDPRVRAVAREAYTPGMSLAEIGTAIGPEIGKGLAARLRSGRYVTNNDETVKRKGGRAAGVDTEQLAQSLDAATATPEG